MVEKRRTNCREGLHQRGTMQLLPCGGQVNLSGEHQGQTTTSAVVYAREKRGVFAAQGNPAPAAASNALMRQSAWIPSRCEQPRSRCRGLRWTRQTLPSTDLGSVPQPSVQDSGSTGQTPTKDCRLLRSGSVKKPGGVVFLRFHNLNPPSHVPCPCPDGLPQ